MIISKFPAPPDRTDYPQANNPGKFARPWIQWFQAITNQFNATPPTVTGSRGGNAALASLLTQLADAGVIVDDTTP